MSFVDENLQNKILNYYRYLEQLKSRELNANTEIKTMYEPYVKDNFYWIWNKTNPWHRQAEFYKDDPRTLEHIDLQSVISNKQLEVMIMNRRYQSILILQYYSNTIKLGKDIIADIDKEQK